MIVWSYSIMLDLKFTVIYWFNDRINALNDPVGAKVSQIVLHGNECIMHNARAGKRKLPRPRGDRESKKKRYAIKVELGETHTIGLISRARCAINSRVEKRATRHRFRYYPICSLQAMAERKRECWMWTTPLSRFPHRRCWPRAATCLRGCCAPAVTATTAIPAATRATRPRPDADAILMASRAMCVNAYMCATYLSGQLSRSFYWIKVISLIRDRNAKAILGHRFRRLQRRSGVSDLCRLLSEIDVNYSSFKWMKNFWENARMGKGGSSDRSWNLHSAWFNEVNGNLVCFLSSIKRTSIQAIRRNSQQITGRESNQEKEDDWSMSYKRIDIERIQEYISLWCCI